MRCEAVGCCYNSARTNGRKSERMDAQHESIEGLTMMRLGWLVGAVALGLGLSAAVPGQDAPRKLVAPVRGEAPVEITAPNTRAVGNDIVTTIRVKNVSAAPIAGFRIEENWYKGNDPVGGDTYRHPRPLPVNEVIEITLTTPRARLSARATSTSSRTPTARSRRRPSRRSICRSPSSRTRSPQKTLRFRGYSAPQRLYVGCRSDAIRPPAFLPDRRPTARARFRP